MKTITEQISYQQTLQNAHTKIAIYKIKDEMKNYTANSLEDIELTLLIKNYIENAKK